MNTVETLSSALMVSPRLRFQFPVMDVFTEVPGALAIWRNEELVHVEVTDDIAFELHVVRHGLNGRSRFLASLFDEVVWPSISRGADWATEVRPDIATLRLVRSQLTYSVVPMPLHVSSVEDLTRALRGAMAPISLTDAEWADGWSLAVESVR